MTNRAKKRILYERDQALLKADHRGQSKFEAKVAMRKAAQEKGLPIPKIQGIYSHSTFGTYKKETGMFVNYVAGKGGDEKHLTNLFAYVKPYIEECKKRKLSSRTIYMRASALACIFGCHIKDLHVELPKRERKDITRTRSLPESIGGRYLQEKYKPIRDFVNATGARRSEIFRIKRNEVLENGDGTMTIILHGKGGKTRTAPIFPGMEDIVRTAFAQSPGYGLDGQYVFPKNFIPEHMAVHGYRAQYAQNLYAHFMALGLGNGKMYYCRKERRGTSYDKGAVMLVSRALGHARCDVVVNHYFYS